MCDRINLKMNPRDVQELFDIVRGLNSYPDWSPRYNVAPTTLLPCVREPEQDANSFPPDGA